MGVEEFRGSGFRAFRVEGLGFRAFGVQGLELAGIGFGGEGCPAQASLQKFTEVACFIGVITAI